jgi:hypothetical protein
MGIPGFPIGRVSIYTTGSTPYGRLRHFNQCRELRQIYRRVWRYRALNRLWRHIEGGLELYDNLLSIGENSVSRFSVYNIE